MATPQLTVQLKGAVHCDREPVTLLVFCPHSCLCRVTLTLHGVNFLRPCALSVGGASEIACDCSADVSCHSSLLLLMSWVLVHDGNVRSTTWCRTAARACSQV